MADSPDRPRDNGRVGLPKVDSAMNKTAPDIKRGGKGDKGDDRPLGQKKSKADDEKILATARKRFERCMSAESENRKAGLDDLKFKAGDQWPSDIQAARQGKHRPCLTVNKIPTFVSQVTNDLRQNRPSICISPVGDRGDVEVAKFYRGMIRAIERDCHADIAYDTAAESAVSIGWGYWRLLTEYESETSFNQVIVVKRVRNPFTVYLDPDRQEPDGEDAKFGFVSEMMPRAEFDDGHPKAQPMPWRSGGIGDGMKEWVEKDQVRVAEYYDIVEEKRELVMLSNGHTGWEDELGEDVKEFIARGDIEILDRRSSRERKVVWYKMTAVEILEREDTVWDSVPIVQVVGNEIDIEGKVRLSGVIRNAKDPQRMYNYWSTAETEIVALAPKAPFIVAEGQIEGHESEWKQANTDSLPYLEYKPTDIAGHPVPPPQRQQPVAAPAGVIQAKQGAAQDMMATTGIRFDATMQERMQDESGRAIRELRRSGDLGSFHYVDNVMRGLRRTGAMMVKAIPKIYDTARTLTILREDDGEERVRIDPHQQQPMTELRPPASPQQPSPKTMKIFNPTIGRYGVTVTIGPSYATKRIEASESMVAFAKAVPNIAPLIADLIAKNMDWPGAEQIASRLAKTLPPQLLTADQKDVPPQVQALIQNLGNQIQQLGIERQKLIMSLTEKNTDRAIAMDEINKAFETKMAAIEERFAEAVLKTNVASEKNQIQAAHMASSAEQAGTKIEHDAFKIFHDAISKAQGKAEAETRKRDPVDQLREIQEKVGGQQGEMLKKLVEGHAALSQSVADTQRHLADLTKLARTPKKLRVNRGKDGRITDVLPEYDTTH